MPHRSLPADWRTGISSCDFRLACDELQKLLVIWENEAASAGQYVVFKTEFLRGWEIFTTRPCLDTALQFIEGAPGYGPMLYDFFCQCSPGGHIHSYSSRLRSRSEPPSGISFIGQDGFYPEWVKGAGRWVFQRTLVSVGGFLENYAELAAKRVFGSEDVIVWVPLLRSDSFDNRHSELLLERQSARSQLASLPLRCYGPDSCFPVASPIVHEYAPEPERWRLFCPSCPGRVGADLEPIEPRPILTRWFYLGRPSLENPGASAAFQSAPPIVDLPTWIHTADPSPLELAYIGQQLWPDLRTMLEACRSGV